MPQTNLPHPEERPVGARLEGRAGTPQAAPPFGERLIEVTIAPEDGGVRLDRALQRQLPELSRTRLKQLILDGRIESGGTLLRDPAQRASAGASILITLPEPEEATPAAQ